MSRLLRDPELSDSDLAMAKRGMGGRAETEVGEALADFVEGCGLLRLRRKRVRGRGKTERLLDVSEV